MGADVQSNMLTVSPKIIKFAKFLGARLRRHKKIP
jgi:hypothetical protein